MNGNTTIKQQVTHLINIYEEGEKNKMFVMEKLEMMELTENDDL